MANRIRRPLEERFWAKVNKSGPIPAHRPELGPCWVWTGSLKNGYGCIGSGGKRGAILYAHRLSYQWHVAPLPPGGSMHVDHLCRQQSCVNPGHLELVTCGENVHRGYATQTPEERHKGGGKCRKGIHEMTPENSYRPPGHPTWRTCRQCTTDRLAAKQLRASQEVSRASSPAPALVPD